MRANVMLIKADTCETIWKDNPNNLRFFHIISLFIVFFFLFDILFLGWEDETGLEKLFKIDQFILSSVLHFPVRVLQVLSNLWQTEKFHAAAAQDGATDTEESAT